MNDSEYISLFSDEFLSKCMDKYPEHLSSFEKEFLFNWMMRNPNLSKIDNETFNSFYSKCMDKYPELFGELMHYNPCDMLFDAKSIPSSRKYKKE